VSAKGQAARLVERLARSGHKRNSVDEVVVAGEGASRSCRTEFSRLSVSCDGGDSQKACEIKKLVLTTKRAMELADMELATRDVRLQSARAEFGRLAGFGLYMADSLVSDRSYPQGKFP